jgi:hypothetical protein
MPTTLRLTKEEEKNLREKCIEINKILVSQGQLPMRESELAHKILKKTIKHVKVEKDGEMIINV